MTPIPLEASDAAACAGLHARCFDRPWSAAEIADLIEGPGAIALRTPDGDPHGFVLARALVGEAEILTVAVDPARRGAGIGRALIEAAADAARAAGAQTLFLEVAVDNAPALALYAATGFRRAGFRPRYYARPGGERVDALVFARDLNTGPSGD